MDSNILDSRDLIAELDEYDNAIEAGDEPDIHPERAEAIRELADEGIEDWTFGATLIHESYFKTYAQELAEDIGAIDRDAAWPLSYIDWDAAADALKMDYTAVTFDGETYYVR